MKPGQTRLLVAGVAILALATVVWLWRSGVVGAAARGPAAPPATPVDIATVTRADVPVYAEGLGTVQAYYTVTVTARVDGQLDRVAFAEGQDVRKGDLLAQIDPRPYQAALDQAIATEAKDAAQLANARMDLERYEELAPDELASKQTVATQRSLVAQLEAQVKVDHAAAGSARTQLDYTTISSPISGRTGLRLVDPGNNVRAASTNGIVVLTQLQPIAVIVSLPQDAIGALTAALGRGAVTAIAMSRDRREELDRGKVELIDNQVDQTTGTLRVKATFQNAQRTLWPGQFVNVRVLTQLRKQVLTIPASAVQRGPDGVFTYLVGKDSSIDVAPLSLGESWGDLVVVERGLEAGQRVVASNQFRLQPKATVSANPAAVAQPAGAL